MAHIIEKKGEQYFVVNDASGSVRGSFKEKKQAIERRNQLNVLHADETKSMGETSVHMHKEGDD